MFFYGLSISISYPKTMFRGMFLSKGPATPFKRQTF
jgi:hypothetical protein